MMRPSLEDVVERALMPPMRCVEIIKPLPLDPLRAIPAPAYIARPAGPAAAAVALVLFAAACAGGGIRAAVSQFDFSLVSTSQPYQADRPGGPAAAKRQAGTIHIAREDA